MFKIFHLILFTLFGLALTVPLPTNTLGDHSGTEVQNAQTFSNEWLQDFVINDNSGVNITNAQPEEHSAVTVKRSIPGSYYAFTGITGSIFQYGPAAPARRQLYTAGACGLSTYFTSRVPPSDNTPLVAMAFNVFDPMGAAQHNQLCGRKIQIKGPNKVVRTAIIADRNLSSDRSIDMTSDLWTAFGARDGDGSVIRVQWKML